MLEIYGKTFKSINAACKYFGVDQSYLSKKSKRIGVPKEVLLAEKVATGIRKYSFIYKGKTYPNLTEVCSEYGLDPVKVQSLMGNRGLSRDEALNLSIKYGGNVPRNRKGIRVTVNGLEFPSKAAAIRHFDVPPAKFYELQKDGLNAEQAINSLKRKDNK